MADCNGEEEAADSPVVKTIVDRVDGEPPDAAILTTDAEDVAGEEPLVTFDV
jgi:hypothetical protein